MKTKSLIILGVVLVASAIAVIIKMRSNADTFSSPAAEVGSTLLKEVPLENVGAFLINDGKNSVEIASKDGKWVVPGRDNFPASIIAVNEMTDTAFNLKVQRVEKGVGKSQFGRLGLAEAGGEAKDEEIGKTVVFKDSAGKDMGSIVVGKTAEAKASPGNFDMSGPQPRPQWIQVKGQDVIYQTATGFSKLDADPKNWLDKEKFFKIEKIKSVAVTGPTPEESWKISREKDAGDLKLEEPAAGEEFDAGKAAGSGNAFAGPSFDDILPDADKAKAALDKPTHTAVIETFDGLTYTVKVGAKVPPPAPDPKADPKDPPPTPAENYYVSYSVAGTLSETPPPYATPAPTAPTAPAEPAPLPADADDEVKKKYEEDKKTFEEAKKTHETAVKTHEAAGKSWEDGKKAAEETFKTELTKKKERITAEQALQTRTFVMQKYTLDPIMKKRPDLMKDKPAAPVPGTTPAADGSTPPVSVTPAIMPPKTPGARIEAVTPAIEVKLPGTEEPKDPPVIAPVEGEPIVEPKVAPKKPDKKKKGK